MLLELHAHTNKHSRCSAITPLELIRGVLRKKLQGLVITEHHYLWSEQELNALRREAEIEEGFLLFAGQEVETDIGHVVVFGAPQTIAKPCKFAKLRKDLPQAALVWAHPLRNGIIPSKKQLLNAYIDAVEIISANHSIKENYYGLSLWHRYKFNAFAGSDCHARETIGVFPTQFLHPLTNLDELVAEIKNGRCHPFVKEIPKSGSTLQVQEIVFGTKGEDENRNRIVVKKIANTEKFNKKKKALALIESLRAHGFDGQQFRIPKVITIDEEEQAVIEEGQRGKTLFELLGTVSSSVGKRYFALAAEWLAQLHAVRQHTTLLRQARAKEQERFDSYHRSFQKVPQLYERSAKELIEFVKKYELSFFTRRRADFVQCHGDYHPKNIIIGQDRAQDIGTLFISVIDFDSTLLLPAAFDVAYFLAQCRNQLPGLTKQYAESFFLKRYEKARGGLLPDFRRSLLLFTVRSNLSIGSFLVKVGKGVGPDMDRLIRLSQRAQAQFEKARGPVRNEKIHLRGRQ